MPRYEAPTKQALCHGCVQRQSLTIAARGPAQCSSPKSVFLSDYKRHEGTEAVKDTFTLHPFTLSIFISAVSVLAGESAD